VTTVAEFLDVPGGRLYYEVDGELGGKPVTFLHAGVAHLRMWDEQLAAFLAAGLRVIRYDTRGFGRTETQDVPFSNRADLAALLDHLDVASTHLVGASRGGTIALDFTLERPERVRSLALLGSSPSGFEHEDPTLETAWLEMEALEEAHDYAALIPLEIDFWLEGPGQPRGRTGPALRAPMERWGADNYADGREYGHPQPLEPPAFGRLSDVGVPALVAWGDLDESGAQAAGQAMRDGIRGARSRVFEGAAHMLTLERPREYEALQLDLVRRGETENT
jgi:3-oxoadipate enol-lactonase